MHMQLPTEHNTNSQLLLQRMCWHLYQQHKAPAIKPATSSAKEFHPAGRNTLQLLRTAARLSCIIPSNHPCLDDSTAGDYRVLDHHLQQLSSMHHPLKTMHATPVVSLQLSVGIAVAVAFASAVAVAAAAIAT